MALFQDLDIRMETPADVAAIREVNEAAFASPAEADLVDALRQGPEQLVSLVAELRGRVVGHVLLSPVSLAGSMDLPLMGLGPMAVLPTHQRRGIGSALLLQALDQCRDRGCRAVVVLGHPAYYPRFGFVTASRHGLRCEYDVPDEAFMVLELVRGALEGLTGEVIYNEAFRDV